MATNIRLLCATTRLRGVAVAYGHAMPCAAPEWVLCDARTHLLAHAFGISGISVPIFRGGPPVHTE